MKKTATLFSCIFSGMYASLKNNVKIHLILFFLFSGLFLTTIKSDAQCSSFGISFTQGANRDNFGTYTTGDLHWINSILQQSNSRYIEGMSTMQRVVFDNLPSCGGNHVLRIKLEARKGDVHAYDFITSWDNALKAAQAIAPGFGLMPANRADPKLHECDEAIGSCSEAACNLMTNGGIGTGAGATFRDVPIIFGDFANPAGPGEENLLISGPPADQNTTRQAIQTYECRYGDNITIPAGQTYAGTYDRSVRVYADGFSGTNGDANNAVLFVGYGDSNPNDGGDTYIYYDIKWSSTSSSVVIEFAAHIAVGVDGLANINPNNCNVTSLGVGYLLNRGASSISGGPYHVIIEDFQDAPGNTPNCEPNLGNQDNQLQGSEILLIPECDLQGPSAACANATATYTATVTNPDNATNANNSTYLWEIINSSQSPPPASIIGAASGNVPQVPAGQSTVPLSITVNTGGTGTYTVKLTITNGAATNTTDDNIQSTCTVTTTVSGGPSIVCPQNQTADACLTQAQVNAAYVAWLATVSGSGTITNDGNPTTGPNKCGGTTTVKFTATNDCGTSTCTASFTVTADNTAPGFTGNYDDVILQCIADAPGSLGTASATDNCGAVTITSSDGTIQTIGCTRAITRTFTATDGCSNTATRSRTVRWIAITIPPILSINGTTTIPLACDPAEGVINATLGSATAIDGCGGAPSVTALDGETTSSGCERARIRTFSATDACGNIATAARRVTWLVGRAPQIGTFSAPPELGCNPTVDQINAALGTVSATDVCANVTITSSDGNTTSDGCGRSRTRTFTATGGCGNTATAARTVTWKVDVTPPAFTGSYTDVTLGCNPADPNGSLGTASATDGCGPVTITSSDGTVQSNGCARWRTRTFTATDGCLNTATTSRTVRWTSDVTPPVFTSTPASVDLNCGDAIPGIVTPTASDACGTPTVTMTGTTDNPANCTTGFQRIITRSWKATDACLNTSTYTQTIRVKCCIPVCTLTQGAYGSSGGNICLPNGTKVNQSQIPIIALTNEPGNMKVFGRQDLNRYWIIKLSDVTPANASNLLNMLPGGTGAKAFELDNVAGVPEYANAPSWFIAPLQASGNNKGKILNQLFAQTLTMYFNTTIPGNGLGIIALNGDSLIIQGRECGNPNPVGTKDTVEAISPSIVSYMSTHGYSADIAGLMKLANDALGGVNISPLKLSDVAGAVDRLNNLFDNCAMVVGYVPVAGGADRLIVSSSHASAENAPGLDVTTGLEVTAYPNPFSDKVRFVIQSKVSGQGSLEVYNMLGQKIQTVYKGTLLAGRSQIVEYNAPRSFNGGMIYIFRVGGKQVTGKLLNIE